MKMTDGLFHKVFDEIAAGYPDIEKEHWIVDIGAAKMADTPEAFDVIVMPNLYGDILSDVAAQIAGSVGLAGSANIGDGRGHVRGDSRLGAAARGTESGQPFRPAAGRRADAGAHRPAGSRRARAQRLAAHHRGRHPHLRHFHGRRQQAEGRHQGIRGGGGGAAGTKARDPEDRSTTPRPRRNRHARRPRQPRATSRRAWRASTCTSGGRRATRTRWP